jgi:hypothetical protein
MSAILAYVGSLICVFIVIVAVQAARRRKIMKARQRVLEQWDDQGR